MKMELNLTNLKELDFGKVDVALQQHLQRCVSDCLDRPGDEHVRVVDLRIEMKPVLESHGDCEHVLMQCRVASKVPSHRSKVFQCKPVRGGHLLFDAESPEHFEQGTFGDLNKETERE
jgi:hypothetical protein